MGDYGPWSGNGRNNEHNRRAWLKRKKIMEEIKIQRGCDRCGYAEFWGALDWDHRPEEKKLFGIAGSHCRRWDAVLAEMEKCDLLCSNCHRLATHERREMGNSRAANQRKDKPDVLRLWVDEEEAQDG